MKLNRHCAEYGPQSAVSFDEVDSTSRDRNAVGFPSPIQLFARLECNQTVLSKVEQIGESMTVSVNAKNSVVCVRVRVTQALKNNLLQFSHRFHMPGLHALRFEWNQNDSTAWPGTLLRPG